MATYEEFYMLNYKMLSADFAESLVKTWKNLTVVKDISEIYSGEPVIMGGDILRNDVRRRLNQQEPTIFIHRGYLGNHLFKQRKWWRYSVNGFANIKTLPTPYSRWDLLNLPKHPWKVKEIKRVLIAPSKMTTSAWDPSLDCNWADSFLDKFPGAEVKIRLKGPKPGIRWSTLWDDLDWADLVVAQASAITVEAFWYGKKVISLYPCPTWAAGSKSTLDDWQDPTEPALRDWWHEHIAWSQFSNQEWMSGEALELIERYIGDIKEYNNGFKYDFKNL